MRVLVCDDEKDRYEEIERAIRGANQAKIEIVPLVEKDLTKELKALFRNINECFTGQTLWRADSASPFDAVDLVILDNKLTLLEIEGTRLTAESIAGYVRAFTAAPYVVSLNKNPDVDFDLRYLVGDYATRADLALNTDHLANPVLWIGKSAYAKDEFSPWYWPVLLKAAERRREQIKIVRANLKEPVCATFGFPDSAIDVLSRHAKGALSPFAQSDGYDGDETIPFNKVSFLDFFLASSRSLPVKADREKLYAEAIAGSDAVCEITSRIIAADIDLWFRRDAVGPQEALVDVPHLMMRMPFLLGDKVSDATAWRKAVVAEDAPFGMERNLFDQFLAERRFKHDVWVRSPCFWWPELRDNEKLNELSAETGKSWTDVVFCEDISDFGSRQVAEGSPPQEFVAEFEGPWSRRFVKQLKDFKYGPRSRFAL